MSYRNVILNRFSARHMFGYNVRNNHGPPPSGLGQAVVQIHYISNFFNCSSYSSIINKNPSINNTFLEPNWASISQNPSRLTVDCIVRMALY